MKKRILEVKGLNVRIGDNEILRNINFKVSRGDVLAVIGPNGAGKTILLKALLGLVPYKGRISLDRGIRIGYVPQRINLDPYMRITVNDLFNIKRSVLKLPESSVREVMKSIPLKEEVLGRPLVNLSGGDLQRVMIIFALIGDPELLLFDEPTANVDLPGEETIHESFSRIRKEKDITLILVSHDLSIVDQHANQVLCINKDMVCAGGTYKMLEPGVLKRLFGSKVLYRHKGHNHY